MAYFQTKNTDLGKILERLTMEDVGTYIIWPFCLFTGYGHGTFCGYLVYFMVIWYIFAVLVCCIDKNLATLAHRIFGYRVARWVLGI
jgi:hypothetical protein